MRKMNKRWAILCGITALFLLWWVACAAHFSVTDKAADKNQQAGLENEQELFDQERYTYAYETCYTGAPYLADVLFRTPFKRTDRYICNSDFIAIIGEDNASILANRSIDASKALFNRSYQERNVEEQELSDILADGLNVIFADGTITESKEDAIAVVNSFFIDNQISMEAEFYTDKCMVFYDDAKVIVRGQMVFSVYGGSESNLDTLRECFGLESMEQGEEYAIVLEMEYISKSNVENYDVFQLAGISLIS